MSENTKNNIKIAKKTYKIQEIIRLYTDRYTKSNENHQPKWKRNKKNYRKTDENWGKQRSCQKIDKTIFWE